jgi:hypothetical protein
MSGIVGFSARRSFAVGTTIGGGNPSNVAVALGTAAAVSLVGLTTAQRVVVLAV